MGEREVFGSIIHRVSFHLQRFLKKQQKGLSSYCAHTGHVWGVSSWKLWIVEKAMCEQKRKENGQRSEMGVIMIARAIKESHAKGYWTPSLSLSLSLSLCLSVCLSLSSFWLVERE